MVQQLDRKRGRGQSGSKNGDPAINREIERRRKRTDGAPPLVVVVATVDNKVGKGKNLSARHRQQECGWQRWFLAIVEAQSPSKLLDQGGKVGVWEKERSLCGEGLTLAIQRSLEMKKEVA